MFLDISNSSLFGNMETWRHGDHGSQQFRGCVCYYYFFDTTQLILSVAVTCAFGPISLNHFIMKGTIMLHYNHYLGTIIFSSGFRVELNLRSNVELVWPFNKQEITKQTDLTYFSHGGS